MPMGIEYIINIVIKINEGIDCTGGCIGTFGKKLSYNVSF